jgi:hypothetical protein
MSLVTFKKKSLIKHGGVKRSGQPTPDQSYMNQLSQDCCIRDARLFLSKGGAGFSLNGGSRSVGGVGRESAMSKSGTPFRGLYAMGAGGSYGTYASPTPVYNMPAVRAEIEGLQRETVKPTVLSNDGYLEKKLASVRHGQYPRGNWVQPNYTGNLTDTAGQENYIRRLSASQACQWKVNATDLYKDYYVARGPVLCKHAGTSTAMFTYNQMARNAPYTKTLKQPGTYDDYQRHLLNRTARPSGANKPFPYAVNTGVSIGAAGGSVRGGGVCNLAAPVTSPPEWYTSESTTENLAACK